MTIEHRRQGSLWTRTLRAVASGPRRSTWGALIAVALVSTLAGCDLLRHAKPEADLGDGTGVEMQAVEEFTVGALRVVLQTVPHAPVINAQVWVGVGAADERPDEIGAAHLLEHLVFKRSEGTGLDLAASVEAVGGSVNAWTSHDRTVYWATAPVSYAPEALGALVDAVRAPTFDDPGMLREVDVVLEELRRSADQPGRMLRESLMGELLGSHPYARPVIGTVESLRSLTPDAVRAFHRRWYADANLVLVVAGSMTRPQVIAALSGLQAASGTAPIHEQHPVPSGADPVTIVQTRDVQQAQLLIAFPTERAEGPNEAPLDVIATLLGQGAAARLPARLQRRDRLVEGVSASSFSGSDHGIFFVGASFRPSDERPLNLLLDALAVELLALSEARIPDEETSRAVGLVESGAIWQRQTVQGIAGRIGYFASFAGDPNHEAAYLRSVARVESRAIQRVARQYLLGERAALALLVPTSSPEAALDSAALRAAWDAAWARARAQLDEPEATTSSSAGLVTHVYPNGLRLVVERTPHAQTFSIRAVVPGGSLIESEATDGHTALVAALLTEGTEAIDGEAMAARLDALTASMSGYSGSSTLGLSMSALSRDFDAATELFAEALFASSFPEDRVARLRSEALALVRSRRDNLAGSAYDQFWALAFGGHAYGRPGGGTESSLARADRDELLSLYRGAVRPSQMVVAVVGDVDVQVVVDRVGALFAVPDGGPSAGTELLTSVPAVPMAAGPQQVSSTRQRQQTHIVVGFPGPSLGSPDAPSVEVLIAILSGQSGRLFTELREQRSLAYSVSAGATALPGAGAITLYIATSADRRDEALGGLLEEVERLRVGGVSAEEVARAQRVLIGRMESGLQTPSARASVYAFHEVVGLGASWSAGYSARIGAVTPESVSAVVARWLVAGGELVSLVEGDLMPSPSPMVPGE